MRWFPRKTVPATEPSPPEPVSLSDDLRRHLYQTQAGWTFGMNSRWVMNAEWLSECRKLDDHAGRFLPLPPVSGPVYILGIPVEVRSDGGAPHLEHASLAACGIIDTVDTMARAVTLTLAEAAMVLDPPVGEQQLRAIVTALGWQPDGARHTGRAGRPAPAYDATRLLGLHAAIVPFLRIDLI